MILRRYINEDRYDFFNLDKRSVVSQTVKSEEFTCEGTLSGFLNKNIHVIFLKKIGEEKRIIVQSESFWRKIASHWCLRITGFEGADFNTGYDDFLFKVKRKGFENIYGSCQFMDLFFEDVTMRHAYSRTAQARARFDR